MTLDKPKPSALDARDIGQQRALAALGLAQQIAEAGIPSNRLFPEPAVTEVALVDPVAPVTHLFATRYVESDASGRYIRELFEAAHAIDPSMRTIAIEFSDQQPFRPIDGAWSDPASRLTNHRDMRARLAAYRGREQVTDTDWGAVPSALPWPWLRDMLIPATTLRVGRRMPAFIQPFHWAVLVPLAGWLHPEFGIDGFAFSMYADGSELRTLTANHQNHGGGLVPVTPRVAIVGTGMSAGLKAEFARLDIMCVTSDVPTWTEHVDELYAIVPDRHARCGRALLYLMPRPAQEDDETRATVNAIRRTTDSVIRSLLRLPDLRDMRSFPVPATVSGRHVVDFNPLNLVSCPLDDRLALLLGRPRAEDREREIRQTFHGLGRVLGRPIDLRFIDLSAIDPKTAGSIHCATMEMRALEPSP